MKKIFSFLMLLAVVPPAIAWAGIKVIPKTIYVAPMEVEKKAISKADAAILTGILVDGIPKYCRQFGNPALVIVSTPDSASVEIMLKIKRSQVSKKKGPWYEINMTLSYQGKSTVINSRFSGYDDLLWVYRDHVPHIVKEQIEPVLFQLHYQK